MWAEMASSLRFPPTCGIARNAPLLQGYRRPASRCEWQLNPGLIGASIAYAEGVHGHAVSMSLWLQLKTSRSIAMEALSYK